MLTLSRKVGESLLVFPDASIPKDMTVAELFANGPIEINCVEVSYNPKRNEHRVKIGIECARELKILRSELEIRDVVPVEVAS